MADDPALRGAQRRGRPAARRGFARKLPTSIINRRGAWNGPSAGGNCAEALWAEMDANRANGANLALGYSPWVRSSGLTRSDYFAFFGCASKSRAFPRRLDDTIHLTLP